MERRTRNRALHEPAYEREFDLTPNAVRGRGLLFWQQVVQSLAHEFRKSCAAPHSFLSSGAFRASFFLELLRRYNNHVGLATGIVVSTKQKTLNQRRKLSEIVNSRDMRTLRFVR